MASNKYCEYFDVNESYFPCIDESAINAGAPWETTYPHETYRSIVDELIIVPDGADTRDTEAVKRISTAYLKLLFPHVQNVSDISPREFKRYCLDRARKMRDTIKYQLGLLDVEYSGKDLPLFGVKGLE